MTNQYISLTLLKGLLICIGASRAAWRDGIYVRSSRFGGDYRKKPA